LVRNLMAIPTIKNKRGDTRPKKGVPTEVTRLQFLDCKKIPRSDEAQAPVERFAGGHVWEANFLLTHSCAGATSRKQGALRREKEAHGEEKQGFKNLKDYREKAQNPVPSSPARERGGPGEIARDH